ncbi:MAG: GGDEF domain-containing protein [Syntrophomonadaceae bacterium]|nr:GGDEF domain-containing protein [Syntrophomonadaceae bacterium]
MDNLTTLDNNRQDAQRLRSLHELVSHIALERNDQRISHLASNWFCDIGFKAVAIYQRHLGPGPKKLKLLGQSGNCHELIALYQEEIKMVSKSKTMDLVYLNHNNCQLLLAPIIFHNQSHGVFFACKEKSFSEQDIDIVLIIINYLTIFWELNHLIAITEQEALVDSLTMVWNRRYIMKRIFEEDEKLKRYHGEACIAIIDLGNLKPINDNFGHFIGDKILKILASTVASNIRTIDVVGRLGGDEFVILFPNTSLEKAIAAMNRITASIARQKIEQLDVDIVADFGVANYPKDGSSLLEAMDVADQRMYAYKRKRKGCHQ